MIKNNRFIFLLLLLLSGSMLPARQSLALNVGDDFLAIDLNNVINFDRSTINTSEFSGKLIILDFWGTNCISCIQAFPKIDSLQVQFSDKVQFILVNKQTLDSTLRFFKKRSKIKLPRNVPFVTNDMLLTAMFPHGGLPYHVWIDTNFKVFYNVSGSSTTDKSISKYFSGESLAMRKYIARRRPVSSLIDPKWEPRTVYFSTVSKYVDSIVLGSNSYFSSDSNMVRFTMTNTIRSLLRDAYNEREGRGFHRPGRLVWDMKDSTRFFIREDRENFPDGWMNKYAYTHDLLIPKTMAAQRYEIMRDDLYRAFGVKGFIETRQVYTLTLVRASSEDRLKTKGGSRLNTFSRSSIKGDVTEPVRSLKNQPFNILTQKLSYWIESIWKHPFADLTNIDPEKLIDIKVEGEVLDTLELEKIRKALKPYGLDLVWRDVLTEVLVLKENM